MGTFWPPSPVTEKRKYTLLESTITLATEPNFRLNHENEALHGCIILIKFA
jgi:hypothetical protein